MTERILNDRYALESKVGEGGMALTYRARDLLLNRIVAVKLMREQFTSDQQFVERFRREAQAAARISHENIASVYDTGSANGTYYIVMEFIEGTDLKQRLRREGPLPITTALELGRQIASALDAAHRGGLVHRDIKPHNIMLTKEGKVKVTDFGIAKMSSEGEDTGVIIGSVHYISPEQARGENTTPTSDIYSLGAVLFEMFTGRTVFEADNAMAVAQKQIYERPPMPRTLRREIPPPVESMILRCLEKDPRARYQSSAELQAVITQAYNQLTQETTIIITPPAPTMDATMVFQKPTKPAAVAPKAPVATARPPQTMVKPGMVKPQPPGMVRPGTGRPGMVRPQVKTDPYRARRGNQSNKVAYSNGNKGWVVGLFLVILAVAVGLVAYRMITPKGPGGPETHGQAGAIPVPSLVGSSRDDAIAKLKELKLTSTIRTDFSDQVPAGQVIRQNPSGGAELKPGSSVELLVSIGPGVKNFTMPDVTGRRDSDAKSAIRSAGYGKDFDISSEASSQPKGTVLRTDPPANSVVQSDRRVTLVLSKGQEAQTPTTTVNETYRSSIPNIGGTDPVVVKIEIIRQGSQPQEMWNGTGMPGDPIQQVFMRGSNEQVTVRMLAGKDADSLAMQEEKGFGPGPNPTP